MVVTITTEAKVRDGCGCYVRGKQGRDGVWRPCGWSACEEHREAMYDASRLEAREPWLNEPVV